jgi:DNA-binding response OmpR family regulator
MKPNDRGTKAKTVLVIDDNALVRASMADALSVHGIRVLQLANGRECLKLLREHRVDAVVIDLITPDLDGIETICALRGSAENLPILAIYGGGRARNMDMLSFAQHLGASAVLAKPLDPSKLINAVRALLAPAPTSEAA